MCHLFESIACVDGQLQNLKWHQQRLERSYKALFHSKSEIDLFKITVPEYAKRGLWKCRLTFDESTNTLDFEPYIRQKIKTLQLVESGISYALKFVDRTEIYELIKKRGIADDILIIKDDLITDSSKANVLLFDGNGWFTPELPLLQGTMRAQLIETGKVKAKPIAKTDLAFYNKIMLVNAMNPFDETRALQLPDAVLN